MNIDNLQSLEALSEEPLSVTGFNSWCEQDDVADFLTSDINDEYVILYASIPHVFIHAIFLPESYANKDNCSSLLKWRGSPSDSWSTTYSSEGACISRPMFELDCAGEQIIFARSFQGTNSAETYYELNQKIAQVLELHYVPEKKSWCKLDANDKIIEVIKVIKLPETRKNHGNTIICAKKTILGEYTRIEGLKLFRMFDFTRCKFDSFNDWGLNKMCIDFKPSDIFGEIPFCNGVGSYSRGFQLADIGVTKERM